MRRDASDRATFRGTQRAQRGVGELLDLSDFAMGDGSDLAVELMNFRTASVTARVFRIPTGTGSPEPPSLASVFFSVSAFIFSVLESASSTSFSAKSASTAGAGRLCSLGAT